MPRTIALCLATTLLAAPPLAAYGQDTSPPLPPAAAAPATPTASSATPGTNAEAERRRSEARTDRRAMFEARLAALRAGLLLTPDQDRMWPAVETAIRGFVALRADQADQRSDRRQDAEDEEDEGPSMGGDDPIAALKDYSDGLLERGRALKAVADSAAPLWATMSDEQKHRLPKLLREMSPRHHPHDAWRSRDREDSMRDEESEGRRPHHERGARWDRHEGWGERGDRRRPMGDEDGGGHADSPDEGPHDPLGD